METIMGLGNMQLPRERETTITITNNWAWCDNESAAALAASVCIVHDPTAKYRARAHKRKHPKPEHWCRMCQALQSGRFGIEHLNDGNRWPSGLLPHVIGILQQNGFSIHIDDRRRPPVAQPRQLPAISWRAHQLEVLQAARSAPRGQWEVPPSGGKTLLMLARWYETNTRGLILVPTRVILRQFRQAAAKFFGIEVGYIGEGSWEIRELTIATAAQLWRYADTPQYQELMQSIDFIGVDEAHHDAALSWYGITMSCPAYYRYLQSATLTRPDGRDLYLEAATGPVLYKLPVASLVSEGQIARPIFYIHKAPRPRVPWLPPKRAETEVEAFQFAYRENILYNDRRNALIARLAVQEQQAGRPCLVLVQYIEHGELIMEALEQLGANAVLVTAKMRSKNIQEILDRVRAGEALIVVGSPVLGEGMDVPTFASVIIAAGGKSNINTVQRVGRGLRPKEGDNTVYIHDFEDLPPFLHEHSHARFSEYKRMGGEIVWKTTGS